MTRRWPGTRLARRPRAPRRGTAGAAGRAPWPAAGAAAGAAALAARGHGRQRRARAQRRRRRGALAHRPGQRRGAARAAPSAAPGPAGRQRGQPERQRRQPARVRCTAADLRVRLDTAAAGVAAGTEYVPLEFTNTSRQPCELAGYPAVALTSGAAGAADRRRGRRGPHAVPASAVLLAPGGVAHAWLRDRRRGRPPGEQVPPGDGRRVPRASCPAAESASYLAHPRSGLHGHRRRTAGC